MVVKVDAVSYDGCLENDDVDDADDHGWEEIAAE